MASKPKTDKSEEKAPAFSPRSNFDLSVSWPMIYPGAEFVFHVRIQLVADAEKVQTEFLMLPDAEQTPDRRHQMDARLLGILSTAPPEGFPDFPADTEAEQLDAAMYDYFYECGGDAARREGMKFICRGAMSKYWKAVTPADYL